MIAPAGLARTIATDPPEDEDIAQIAITFAQLMRSAERAKQQYLTAALHDVEWSAHLLINQIGAWGPMRSGVLAEKVQSDPSTVSRQVASLVRDGLVARQADPADGRASLLALTAEGQAAYERHLQIRTTHFAHMLADWPSSDREQFATLLARFTHVYDAFRASFFLAPGRADVRTAIPGGDN